MPENAKFVYMFEEGNQKMVDLLGGKGAGLSEMLNLGLTVPPGFTITTETCRRYMKQSALPEGMLDQAMKALKKVETRTGRKYGDASNPLLVSVRSGAPISMPGMMDTILNVGLNDSTVQGLAKLTGNKRFALDSYRRLLQMYGTVVLGIHHEDFEEALSDLKRKYSRKSDVDLTEDNLQELISSYLNIYRKRGMEFPQDPNKQLVIAIEAVFKSWNSERAKTYREINHISDDMGTAVNVVAMIFGNMGNDSATGVAFTRDPNTGEKKLFAEYLTNAQGEDVVSGSRTPRSIADLEKEIPGAYADLIKFIGKLEDHYRDMLDIEFTIEQGKLYMLQVRVGKRSARAALKIAVDLVKEKKIDEKMAIMHIGPEILDSILHPQIKKTGKEVELAKGLAASPGAAIGTVVFSSSRAVELAKEGKKLILVRPETTADDVRGMSLSQGFLTQKGGMTSHAAVVARAMGKPAVVGAEEITVDAKSGILKARNFSIKEGDTISIDGTSGTVYRGTIELESAKKSEDLDTILTWCNRYRKLGVKANANTPEEAKLARENGAEGIGLARTERMFLGNDRIPIVRSMILSSTTEERKKYLNKLLPMQLADFVEFFRVMEGYPVVIRLLDPPLHEFLPDKESLINEINNLQNTRSLLRGKQGKLDELKNLLETVKNLEEFNPMLGFRGCRIGLLYPEIYEMQVRAIMEAAKQVEAEGRELLPEIMIPLVGHPNELRIIRERLVKVIEETLGSKKINYKLGTMIEVPRSCLVADKIAEYADFFSFGTNDLTQMTYGYSRDDAEGKFISKYLEQNIIEFDPFNTIDRDGVGELMKIGVERGRKTRKDLEIGICGEQGGDPQTIEFCHEIGLDYVSSSPFRIPVAILVAARASIKSEKTGSG
jgi:pyruvate,orthophosphate dikinase